MQFIGRLYIRIDFDREETLSYSRLNNIEL